MESRDQLKVGVGGGVRAFPSLCTWETGIREAALGEDEGLSGASAQDAVGDNILFGSGVDDPQNTALPGTAPLGTAGGRQSRPPVLREQEGG